MNSLLYILKTSLKNRLKKALRKPTFYAIFALAIVYAFFMYMTITESVRDLTIEQLKVIVFFVMVAMVLLSYTASLWSVANKRSIPFKKADVHFLFSAPISPKLNLLYAAKTFFISAIFALVVFLVGIFVLHLEVVTMLLLSLSMLLIGDGGQLAISVIVYGLDDEKKTISNIIRMFVKGIIGFLVGYFLYMYFVENTINIFSILSNPILFFIPFIGWGISLYYSILIEPTSITLICTSLYIMTTISLIIYAYKMKSSGDYYEDASNYADEYEEIMKQAKKGQFKVSMKQKKLKKANIVYKGSFAKAILYRQLLEYKKQRFFIFGFKSIINLILGSAISYFLITNLDFSKEVGNIGIYGLIGIMAYAAFLSSGYQTKWTKEINVMYTFLIPDKPINKLWYATVIEHLRSCIDGVILVVAASIGLKLNLMEILLAIGIYITIEVTKLYLQIVTQTILQPIVGKGLTTFIMMVSQGLLYGIGAIIIGLGNIIFTNGGLFIVIIVGALFAWLLCFIASTQFERMESFG